MHGYPLIVLFAQDPALHFLAMKAGLTDANFAKTRAAFEPLLERDLPRNDRTILFSAEKLSAPESAAGVLQLALDDTQRRISPIRPARQTI